MAVRVMVVDDSNFMRKALSKLIGSEPGFVVSSLASSGEEALRELPKIKPHVIVLDVEMGGMDGLETLRRIMDSHPTPVIMFSAFTRSGADITLHCLQEGAVDFMEKPSGTISMDLGAVKEELVKKLRVAVRVRPKKRALPLAERKKALAELVLPEPSASIVVIGSSTGGVQALHNVIPRLPSTLPLPVLIVQHMPPKFTESLAESLNADSRLMVKEAVGGDRPRPGQVYIAPGGFHMTVKKDSMGVFLNIGKEPEGELLRPSVDVLFNSVAELYGKDAIGVVLTGMGDDGAKGLKSMKTKGALTISQDEASSVIYGMPKFAAVSADIVLHINQIAGQIESMILSAKKSA